MIVYEYNQRGRLKPVTTLMTPDTGNVKVMLMDRIKNYFFAGVMILAVFIFSNCLNLVNKNS